MHFEQEVAPQIHPTLCEVTYQSLGDEGYYEGEIYTPYRYRGLSAHPSNSGYYSDYTTVGCRTPHSFTSNQRATTALSVYSAQGNRPSRAQTLTPGAYYHDHQAHQHYSNNTDSLYKRKERAKTAPSLGLPSLREKRHRNGSPSRNNHRRSDSVFYSGPDGERLKWVPSLNTWVSAKESQNPVPYLNFVNTAVLSDRGIGHELGVDGHELPVLPCGRYLAHMSLHEETLRNLYAQKNAHLHNQKSKREAHTLDVFAQRAKSSNAKKTARVSIREPSPPRLPKNPPQIESLPPREPTPDPPPKQPSPPKTPTPIPEEIQENDAINEGKSDSEHPESSVDEQLQAISADSPEPSIHNDVQLGSPPKRAQDKVLPKSPKSPPKSRPKAPKPQSPRKPKVSKQKDKQKDPSASKKKSKEIKNRPEKLPYVILEDPPTELSLNVASSQTELRQSSASDDDVIDLANQIQKNPLEKRVRWRAQPKNRKCDHSGDDDSSQNSGWQRGEGGWLYGDDDFSTSLVKDERDSESGDDELGVIGPPPLPEFRPSSSKPSSASKQMRPSLPKVAPDWANNRWGMKKRDRSWEEEQERKRLAEERREKALEMYERLRKKHHAEEDDVDLTAGPNFEDYGWLAKYCIFQRGNLAMFKRTFDIMDEKSQGYLGPVDTIIALRTINNKLSLSEEEYLYRILEMAGYSVTAGADFKLFAVMAALSQRISTLDDWMKHLIGKMDFATLERKMFMCKNLWEFNVDPDTNKISIDQLCVELRAGGVSYEHECEVRDKLGHLGALDLIDFMTYIPLFIMIHESVLENPLDDNRDK